MVLSVCRTNKSVIATIIGIIMVILGATVKNTNKADAKD